MKEFLEDYDDERDDPKFYKGREMQRRLQDRWDMATKVIIEVVRSLHVCFAEVSEVSFFNPLSGKEKQRKTLKTERESWTKSRN